MGLIIQAANSDVLVKPNLTGYSGSPSRYVAGVTVLPPDLGRSGVSIGFSLTDIVQTVSFRVAVTMSHVNLTCLPSGEPPMM